MFSARGLMGHAEAPLMLAMTMPRMPREIFDML